jgi:hypothetical protein
MISTGDILFNKDEFYDRKPIWFTNTLISKLDEAIIKVTVASNKDLDHVQLREDSNIKDAVNI